MLKTSEFDCKNLFTLSQVFFFTRFNFLSAASLCQFLLDSLMCFIFNFHVFIPDGRGELWSRALARYEANSVYVSSSHRTLFVIHGRNMPKIFKICHFIICTSSL